MKTLPITDPGAIETAIRSCRVCFLGLADGAKAPYVIPMNFVYFDGAFYLHTGSAGRKYELLQACPEVTLTLAAGEEPVCQHPDVACSYSMRSVSVVCSGPVEFVEGDERKAAVLDRLMALYADRPFRYAAPALNNVRIWRIVPARLTCLSFGNSVR